MQATHLTLMPLVVEHTIYSIVNVLRPAVRTNQNNFVQLLCNQFSCCVHAATCPHQSLVTLSQQSSAQAIQKSTAQLAQLLYSHLITILCDNTLRASCTRIATHQFFDPVSPGSSDSIGCKPRPSSASYIQRFGQSLFHMPKSTACKTFNLACILLLQLSLQLWKSLHTGIPKCSKHNVSQVHRCIARAACTT